MKIACPKRPTTHPDRHLDREEAIEVMFQAVAAAAEAVGWTQYETAAALISLAERRSRRMTSWPSSAPAYS